MNKIVLIAPFKDLAEKAIKVIKENKYHVDIQIGDLSEGVKVAKACVEKGAKIIISRGGTYTMIKNAVNVPVVELKMNSFDLLRGFSNITPHDGKIGVAGYSNIIYGSEIISKMLNLDTEKVIYNCEERVVYDIKMLHSKGINVFLSDHVGCEAATKIGCKSYLITSGKEAIIEAIHESLRILHVLKSEKIKVERIKILMDFIHEGIIAIDKNGYITIFNKKSEEIFGFKSRQVLYKKIDKIIPNINLLEVLETGKPEIDYVKDINNTRIVTNIIPIIVDGVTDGVVATFEYVTQLQETEQNIRRKLSGKGLIAKYTFDDIIYQSKTMENCICKAKNYSHVDSPVLILGETGVGKELIAQSIHNASDRSSEPFVAVNCAAIPPNLIESELFGYAKGAFTGASKDGKIGLFELAHKGTIFLDEIAEIPIEYQARLLRVIQENQVMRIGDDRIIPIDIRIITATNKDLTRMIEEGKFREDLFYRINILPLNVPPLRMRREDIILLSKYFMKKYSCKYNKNIINIDNDAEEYLLSHKYKGNTRELEGIIERAVALCQCNTIKIDNILINVSYEEFNEYKIKFPMMNLNHMEKIYINKIINICNGNLSKASIILGINRSTLWRKLKNGERGT